MMATDPDSSCSYKIHLSNRDIEDEHDRQISSAADFRVILENVINLNNKIFLKALNAEMALDDFFIHNLPVSISKEDSISITTTIDPSIARPNIFMNSSKIESQNKHVLKLMLCDMILMNNSHILEYVNKKLNNKANLILCGRYLEIFLDTDLWNDQYNPTEMENLNRDEISLCMYYIELGFFFRETIINVISSLLREDDPKTIHSKFNRKMSSERERQILKESTYLLKLSERERGRLKLFPIETYLDLNSNDVNDLRHEYENRFKTFLLDSGYFSDENDISDSQKNDLIDFRDKNIALLLYGQKCQQILQLMADPKAFVIWESNILSLTMTNSEKCHFNMFPEKFLVPDGMTKLLFQFQGRISYTLGSNDINENLFIGPLTNPMPSTDIVANSHDHIIAHQKQSLFSTIRVQPKLFHILFNIVSNECYFRNMWLRNTEFENFFIVATIINDSTTKENKSISKQTKDRIFYRVRQANSIIDSLKIVVVDENFRRVKFCHKTYCDYAMCVRPSPND